MVRKAIGVKKIIVCTIVTVLLISLLTPIAYAHRVIIRFEEPGLLRVLYDDNSIARRAEVVLLDGDNKELVKGPVNQDGYFSYNRSLNPKLAIATDGLGHRAQLDVTVDQGVEIPMAAKAVLGVEIPMAAKAVLGVEIPMAAKAVLGVAMLVSVAAFFHYRNNKLDNEEKLKKSVDHLK